MSTNSARYKNSMKIYMLTFLFSLGHQSSSYSATLFKKAPVIFTLSSARFCKSNKACYNNFKAKW